MKDKEKDWSLPLIRIAGASFPGSASLVQWQAEIDTKEFSKKIKKFEDPISHIHEDIPELSKKIYAKLKEKNERRLQLNEEFYPKYSRALASLESSGFIKAKKGIFCSHIEEIYLGDPSYIIYLAIQNEKSNKMKTLHQTVDTCPKGTRLDGYTFNIDLPILVIQSVFDIYVAKGYGIDLSSLDECKYQGIV